jgi:hypothetical protein
MVVGTFRAGNNPYICRYCNSNWIHNHNTETGKEGGTLRLIFKILIFFIFFNMGLFFIASTNFFPYTFYGDATTYGLDDPDNLPTPDEMFTRLITNSVTGEVASIGDVQLTFGWIMGGLIIAGLGASYLTHSTQPIALMLIGSLFTAMWANSKRVLDAVASGMGSAVQYLVLMFAVGVLILFVITLVDMASGQKSTS